MLQVSETCVADLLLSPVRYYPASYLRGSGQAEVSVPSVARPIRQLKNFQRIALGPGESRRVEFTIGRDELAIWQSDTKYEVEPAELTIWIAPNAQSGKATRVLLK